jgi:competence protein ComEC
MNHKFVFQSATLLLPVLAYLAGIAIGDYVSITILPATLLASLSFAGYLFFRRRFTWARYCLLAMACSAGLIHHYRFNHTLPANHLCHYLQRIPLDELGKVNVSATIVSPPIIRQPEKTFPYHTQPDLRTRFMVDADGLKIFGRSVPVTGLIAVSIPGMWDEYQPGQQVELSGRLVQIPPCQPDMPCLQQCSVSKHNALFARLFVNSPDQARILTTPSLTWPGFKHRLQRWARAGLLGDEPATGEYTHDLLSAVILGKRNLTENALNQALVRIGAAHFLAVSGFHLFALSLGIWFLSAMIGLPRRQRALLVICCVLVYATLTDFRPSITRAAIMTIALCGGILLNRPTNSLNSLALAAGVIVLINPNQLFQPGFQLSFIATLGLIRLSKPLYFALFAETVPADDDPPTPAGSARVIGHLLFDKSKLLLAVSIAAALAATPLAMVHFNRFSLIGPVGSVLIYPLATLLTLTGFLQLVVGFLCPAIVRPISYLTDLTSIAMSKLSLVLGSLPGVAFDVPSPAWPLVLIYFLILFLPTLRHRKLLLLSIVTIYLSTWVLQADPARSWIYAAGPAEGQTTVVNTGGELVLIDCGGTHTGQTAELIRKLDCNFLSTPRLAFCTAADQRCFNDIWTQAALYPDMELMIPAAFNAVAKTSEPVQRLVQDETLRKQFLSPGGAVSLNVTRFELLLPPDPNAETLPSELLRSGAILVTQNGHRVLIASNLTDLACRLLETNYPDLRIDTLLLSGSIPIKSLERWIVRTGIRQIGALSSVRRSSRQQLKTLAARHHCRFLEARSSGGFLVNKP